MATTIETASLTSLNGSTMPLRVRLEDDGRATAFYAEDLAVIYESIDALCEAHGIAEDAWRSALPAEICWPNERALTTPSAATMGRERRNDS